MAEVGFYSDVSMSMLRHIYETRGIPGILDTKSPKAIELLLCNPNLDRETLSIMMGHSEDARHAMCQVLLLLTNDSFVEVAEHIITKIQYLDYTNMVMKTIINRLYSDTPSSVVDYFMYMHGDVITMAKECKLTLDGRKQIIFSVVERMASLTRQYSYINNPISTIKHAVDTIMYGMSGYDILDEVYNDKEIKRELLEYFAAVRLTSEDINMLSDAKTYNSDEVDLFLKRTWIKAIATSFRDANDMFASMSPSALQQAYLYFGHYDDLKKIVLINNTHVIIHWDGIMQTITDLPDAKLCCELYEKLELLISGVSTDDLDDNEY